VLKASDYVAEHMSALCPEYMIVVCLSQIWCSSIGPLTSKNKWPEICNFHAGMAKKWTECGKMRKNDPKLTIRDIAIAMGGLEWQCSDVNCLLR